MKNPDGVLHVTGLLLAVRASHGHDLRNPKVISEAVDAAELAVNEIDRRILDSGPEPVGPPPLNP